MESKSGRIRPRETLLGNHPRQSQESRLALRLYLKYGCQRPTILVVAAEREHAGRFIVRADERLTAFLELELAIGPTPSVNFLSGKEMINEQLFPPRLFGYTFWAMQKGVELRIITRRARPRSQVAGRGRQRMSVATVALG